MTVPVVSGDTPKYGVASLWSATSFPLDTHGGVQEGRGRPTDEVFRVQLTGTVQILAEWAGGVDALYRSIVVQRREPGAFGSATEVGLTGGGVPEPL